jgi:signal transduction histidine kinase
VAEVLAPRPELFRRRGAPGLKTPLTILAHDIERLRQRGLDDITEIVGNLLENAGKWARRVVSLHLVRDGGNAVLVIEDDGPGVPDEHLHCILRRGERADESVAGTGLGLAIAREITQACGGSLTLDRSPLGGLAVRIVLPEGA